MDLIDKFDLEAVPGITGTDATLTYVARRASTAVASKWCHPIDPAPDWVKDIAIDVAVRYLNNPKGITSVTRSVDDASRTERFENTGQRMTRGFELTDEEIAALCPVRRNRVGSIRLRVPGVCR